MMLGLLLARAGVDVVVLEKHADFLRDFRGDTIHPSTLELLHELGVLQDFLKLPHQQVHEINAQIGDVSLPVADFRHLPTRCKFIAFMPQWDFLNFLAALAGRYPSFDLRMRAEVTGLIEEAGRTGSCAPSASPGFPGGTGRACCASGTPPTRCPRSAASASTSRSRMRSPPPTCSPSHSACGGSPRAICAECSGAASCPRASPN